MYDKIMAASLIRTTLLMVEKLMNDEIMAATQLRTIFMMLLA